MINEIIEYARSNSIECGVYASLFVGYWSGLGYLLYDVHRMSKMKKSLRDESVEDRLTPTGERILSGD